ncbi:MAG: hypothetical protein U9N53_11930 [Bacteroidota bacterium]|nr:hypothetical protein [Bacteroidota bacterium]
MKDLLDKLSSYNIFNYLLPGILFVVLTQKLTSFSFVQKDIVLGVFLYYFIGLVISRIGSLFIEPILKKIKFITFASYSKFVSASKADTKLDTLSEVNNMYRTLCSLFVFLIILKCYELITIKYPVVGGWNSEILLFGLLVLFLFAYKKQTKYITKRIAALTEKE